MMQQDLEKALEMERQKEVEKWHQGIQYQEELEQQLEMQVRWLAIHKVTYLSWWCGAFFFPKQKLILKIVLTL